MPATRYVPHISLLLDAMRITRDRLNSSSKIAVNTELIRNLLQLVCESQPFTAKFYLESYPDIRAASEAGQIPNLRRHMVEQGYFEGRLGARPHVDEAFYLAMYPDVNEAISRGEVTSATEHYVRAGAAEGRIPSEALQSAVNHWNRLLRSDRDNLAKL